MYQFITLPLGISATSRIFTFILKPVLALLRATGVKLHTYMDKWLGSALSRLLARNHGLQVTQLLSTFGGNQHGHNTHQQSTVRHFIGNGVQREVSFSTSWTHSHEYGFEGPETWSGTDSEGAESSHRQG